MSYIPASRTLWQNHTNSHNHRTEVSWAWGTCFFLQATGYFLSSVAVTLLLCGHWTEALWVEGRSSGNKQEGSYTDLPYKVSPKLGFTAPTDKWTMREGHTTWQNSLIRLSNLPFNSSAYASEALPLSLFFMGHSRGKTNKRKKKKRMSSFYNCLVLDHSTFKIPSQLV